MSRQEALAVSQSEIFGIANGVNNGDIYLTTVNGTSALEKTLKQKTEEDHQAAKAGWSTADTTGWLEKKDEITAWAKMENQHSVLWIDGLPGCGKTTL
ncbi:hypothetical protein BKA80DRAFT_265633, partial [Phyllosticta citrichinensis]